MVPEAKLEHARENRWYHADGRAALCDLEGDRPFPQLGININVLEPGQSIGLYHWEADQEDFLVLAGEALLLVEEQERPLRQWDFVHCPPRTNHMIVGAGTGPCVILAVGARVDSGAERDTSDPDQAYASWTRRSPVPYRDGWLPD